MPANPEQTPKANAPANTTVNAATNGQSTRENIVRKAAEVFNTQGFAGASISDIMKATGLKKGGIYNHFTSKEQLWVESFTYAYKLVADYFDAAIAEHKDAVARLHSFVDCFRTYAEEPIMSGGCPLLNTAIESDSTNPVLRDAVRKAFDDLSGVIERVVQKGIEREQLRKDVNAKQIASVFITVLEGGVMLSQLYDDPSHMDRVADHLADYVNSQLRPAA